MNSVPKRGNEVGMSLLETVIALTILVVTTVGIMGVEMIALQTTENQGHLQSRAAEYAQDKMEELISLAYGDGDAGPGTDTTMFPSMGRCNTSSKSTCSNTSSKSTCRSPRR